MKRISLILISVAIVLMTSIKASKRSEISKFTGKYLKIKQDPQNSESTSSTKANEKSSRIPKLKFAEVKQDLQDSELMSSTKTEKSSKIPTLKFPAKSLADLGLSLADLGLSLADLGLTIEDENLWENLEPEKLRYQGIPKDNYFAHDDVKRPSSSKSTTLRTQHDIPTSNTITKTKSESFGEQSKKRPSFSKSTTLRTQHDIPTSNTITKTKSESFREQSKKIGTKENPEYTRYLATAKKFGFPIVEEFAHAIRNPRKKKQSETQHFTKQNKKLPEENHEMKGKENHEMKVKENHEMKVKENHEMKQKDSIDRQMYENSELRQIYLKVTDALVAKARAEMELEDLKKVLKVTLKELELTKVELQTTIARTQLQEQTEKDDNDNTMKKNLSWVDGDIMIEHDNDNSMRKILSPQSESCQFPKSWTISYKENGKQQMMGPDLRIWNSSEENTPISDDDISDDESTEAITSSPTSDGHRKK